MWNTKTKAVSYRQYDKLEKKLGHKVNQAILEVQEDNKVVILDAEKLAEMEKS